MPLSDLSWVLQVLAYVEPDEWVTLSPPVSYHEAQYRKRWMAGGESSTAEYRVKAAS